MTASMRHTRPENVAYLPKWHRSKWKVKAIATAKALQMAERCVLAIDATRLQIQRLMAQ
jgi:hypothetical protein